MCMQYIYICVYSMCIWEILACRFQIGALRGHTIGHLWDLLDRLQPTMRQLATFTYTFAMGYALICTRLQSKT